LPGEAWHPKQLSKYLGSEPNLTFSARYSLSLQPRPHVSCVGFKRYDHIMIILQKYDHVIGDFHVRPLFELPYSIELSTLEVSH